MSWFDRLTMTGFLLSTHRSLLITVFSIDIIHLIHYKMQHRSCCGQMGDPGQRFMAQSTQFIGIIGHFFEFSIPSTIAHRP